MSKRAEEKATDAWAIYEYREHPKGLYHTCFVDGYKEGYEQAEKDLALALEDIVRLDCLIMRMVGEGYNDGYKTRPFYEEVIRRFNDQYRKK